MADEHTGEDPGGRPIGRMIAVGAVVLAAAVAGLLYFLGQRPPGDGLLQVNGRIEGDRITIASKYPGRVAELLAREGDVVQAGQVLLRLDDRALKARLDQARAGEETLRAQLAAQVASLAVLRGETGASIESAKAQLDAARAEARRADAGTEQSEREARRAAELGGRGFLGPQALERADLAWRQAIDQGLATQASASRAAEVLRDARLGPVRVRAKEAEVAATRARLKEAAAAVAEAQTVVDELVIVAPLAGTVTARYGNVGEVVEAGTPLLELVDLTRLYLKGYVPEPMVGKVQRGLPARIHVDAFPDQPIAATLRYVAARAEFTPKEVQTRGERVKLVYEVRLYADADPQGRLNPGQPADGMIRWREDAAWAPPRR